MPCLAGNSTILETPWFKVWPYEKNEAGDAVTVSTNIGLDTSAIVPYYDDNFPKVFLSTNITVPLVFVRTN